MIQTLNAQTAMLYNPFHIAIDPMDRILLVNFEKDPDSLYIGVEPQVFNDSINGKGHLVIGWRIDGMVDVYHEPGLTLLYTLGKTFKKWPTTYKWTASIEQKANGS